MNGEQWEGEVMMKVAGGRGGTSRHSSEIVITPARISHLSQQLDQVMQQGRNESAVPSMSALTCDLSTSKRQCAVRSAASLSVANPLSVMLASRQSA